MGCTIGLKACVGQHDDQSLGVLVSRWDGDMLFGNKPWKLWWGERLGSCSSQHGQAWVGGRNCGGGRLSKRYVLDSFRLSGLLAAISNIVLFERGEEQAVVVKSRRASDL